MLTRWECWFLLKREIDLFVGNGVLLYKLLICLMIENACPAWRSAARTVVRRLYVLLVVSMSS